MVCPDHPRHEEGRNILQVCCLQLAQRPYQTRELAFAEHQGTSGSIGWPQVVLCPGWVQWVLYCQDEGRRYPKDHVLHTFWDLRLCGHAFWPQEHAAHLLSPHV